MKNEFLLIESNSLDKLVELFSKRLSSVKNNPLAIKEIIVQTDGMATWLKQQIAQHNGIASNLSFTNPAKFILKLNALITGESEQRTVFEPRNMKWFIYSELLENSSDYLHIDQYLKSESAVNYQKLYSLSNSIAELFDSYLLYRPDMLNSWSNGEIAKENNLPLFKSVSAEHEKWQMKLWQKMIEKHTTSNSIGQNPLNVLDHLRDILNGKGSTKEHENLQKWAKGEQVLQLFGMSILPPRYMEILKLLSNYIQVELYITAPSYFYWGDLLTDRQVAFRKRLAINSNSSKEYLTIGNRLLRNFGEAGRDFISNLYSIAENINVHEVDIIDDIDSNTLLAEVKKDILEWRDNDRDEKVGIAADNSVKIVSTHNKLREVEILYDYILELIENNNELTLGDILVVAPNIEEYAPFITMQFSKRSRLKGTITDRSLISQKSIYLFIKELLYISDSRFEASQLISLFVEFSRYQERELDSESEAYLRKWVAESGIRWGIDSDFWESESGVSWENGRYSWTLGFDRIISGFALGEDSIDLIPYSDISDAMSTLLGEFIAFVKQLFALYQLSQKSKKIEKWADSLKEWLSHLFNHYDYEHEDVGDIPFLSVLIKSVQSIKEEVEHGFCSDKELPFNIVRNSLVSYLEKESEGSTFLRGNITFSSTIPLRTVPFKVIAMIGMNHDAFPRATQELSFDLMKLKKRSGDRDFRKNDLYLFLETIIAAKEYLYLSYTGTNSSGLEVPPSSVVEQFLNYCDENYTINGNKVSSEICRVYPLQPFSIAYQKKENSFKTYQKQWFTRKERENIIENIFTETFENQQKSVSFGEVIAYLEAPIHDFFRRVVHIEEEELHALIEDSEPFESNHLINWQLRNKKIADYLNNEESFQREVEELRLSGNLPPAMAEEKLLGAIEEDAHRFIERLPANINNVEGQVTEYTTTVNELEFTLKSNTFYPLNDTNYFIDSGKITVNLQKGEVGSVKRLFRFWLSHLMVNVTSPSSSTLITLDATLFLPPLEDAEEMLDGILAIYQRSRTQFLPYLGKESIPIGLGQSTYQMAVEEAVREGYNKEVDPIMLLLYNRYGDCINESVEEEAITLSQEIFACFEYLQKGGESERV